MPICLRRFSLFKKNSKNYSKNHPKRKQEKIKRNKLLVPSRKNMKVKNEK
jgi:hypothetical protein